MITFLYSKLCVGGEKIKTINNNNRIPKCENDNRKMRIYFPSKFQHESGTP